MSKTASSAYIDARDGKSRPHRQETGHQGRGREEAAGRGEGEATLPEVWQQKSISGPGPFLRRDLQEELTTWGSGLHGPFLSQDRGLWERQNREINS